MIARSLPKKTQDLGYVRQHSALSRAVLLVVQLCLCVAGPLVRAQGSAPLTPETPIASDRTGLPSLAAANAPIALTAGDHGPSFSLSDLASYTPPPPRPTSLISPPVWKVYPSELDAYPTVSRLYAPETIDYLAHHEVHYGDPQSGYVALTFDCETGTTTTRQILDILRQEHVWATFFILGRYAYTHPEIARQIVEDGHEIGSHSFFHPLFTSIQPITATLEITYTEAAVARAVGAPVPMRYFRFPYGGRNNATRAHVAALGYQSAFWDMDAKGWEPGKTPADVTAYMSRAIHPGGIAIMHCGCANDAQALARVIQLIRERGLEPGRLSDVVTQEDGTVPGYALPSP